MAPRSGRILPQEFRWDGQSPDEAWDRLEDDIIQNNGFSIDLNTPGFNGTERFGLNHPSVLQLLGEKLHVDHSQSSKKQKVSEVLL